MRALFDDGEVVDFAEPLPNLRELGGEQLPEKRADADAGKIIPAASN